MAIAPAHASPSDFSLFRGGPWFHLERRLGFIRPESPVQSFTTRVIVGLLIGWAPMALMSLLEGAGGFDRFASDRPVQSQALFAIPVLLAFELYTDGRIRIAAQRPIALGLLPHADEARYRAAVERAGRWRDAPAVQIVLLLGAFAYSAVRFFFQWGTELKFSPWAESLTPAGAWYFAVTLPLFWLAFGMWLWRFVIWSELLYSLSRLPLNLIATHADRTGGLRFLANAQASFAPAVFALGCVLTGRTQFPESASLTEGVLFFSQAHVVYAVVCLAALHLPLASFAPQLLDAKRRSDLWLSDLVARHGRSFTRRWANPREGGDPLGRPDFSSMIDLSSSYELLTRMRWLPFGVRATLGIVAAALGSLLPRLILEGYLPVLLRGLMPHLL